MNFRFQLSRKRKKEIENILNSSRNIGDFQMVRRCSAILFLSFGNPQSQVAGCFQIAERTLRRWLSIYLSKGIQGLQTKKSKGRPSS